MLIESQLLLDDEEDAVTLKKVLLPVNIKKLKSSIMYRQIVINCIDYLILHMEETFTNGSNSKGIAAAELAIPFNIIVFKTKDNKFKVCINPKITRTSIEKKVTESTSASSKNIKYKVERWDKIDLTYFNHAGQKFSEKNIDKSEGGYTIQHLVERNKGISLKIKAIK